MNTSGKGWPVSQQKSLFRKNKSNRHISPDCLIRPARGEKTGTRTDNTGRRGANTKAKSAKQGISRRGAKSEPSRPLKRKAGWAKPKKKKQ